MNPVTVIALPHNARMDFDLEGGEDVLGTFSDLPVDMPKTLSMWCGADGKPAAMWCDDKRIRPKHFGTVQLAVQQFNADCDRPGFAHDPPDGTRTVEVHDGVSDNDSSDEDDPDEIDYSGGFGRP